VDRGLLEDRRKRHRHRLYTGIHLAPIVQPEQSADFEAFAYAKFREEFGDNTTQGAQSHFKEGIWVMDASIETEDNRYHDTDGISIHGSDYQFLAPKLQHGLHESPYLMMNVHGFKRQGEAVDAVVDCVNYERNKTTSGLENHHNCQAVSAFNPPKMHSQTGPFGFIASPIFPANDPDTLVGFIFGAVFWSEVMESMFPEEVVGIDCVFSTGDEAYTYQFVNGSASYLGEGDMHDPNYDELMDSTLMVEPDSMAKGSAVYTTTCYPNDDFVASYTTDLPLKVALASSLIILAVSLMFLMYDRFVTQEFDSKKELLEAKRQFVRFVSHEVRTPLNSVSMGLTLMKEEMAQSMGYKSAEAMLENPDQRDLKKKRSKEAEEAGQDWFNLAHEVHTSAQSSVDVLNDLLNYDKIENGQLALEMSVVPIWNLIDRTIGEFKLPMTSKNIKLHFELPEMEKITDPESLTLSQGKVRDQKIIGDTVRITQVLRNLVSNAIKFTPEGGDITVGAKWEKSTTKQKARRYTLKNRSVVTHEPTGTLVVTVTDTGAGMTKDQLAKLFGQGIQFNVNELQHGNGSGLGLYIAMGIVQQHAGSLTCDSKGLGKGTTFTMQVPLFDIPSPESDKRQMMHADSAEEGDNTYEDSKLNILIVDDANSNRKLLRRLLKLKGHDTAEAENGQIAVNMVREAERANKHYDLVLMDYEMPVMIGPVAAKEIRNLGSDVFIIGVTGNLMPEDVAYFRQCGSNSVLPKPFRMNELEEIIIEHHITPHAEGSAYHKQRSDSSLQADGPKLTFADSVPPPRS
jgi:signal transduction histidine kinase/FixJ family two-component response regulator